MDNNDSSTRNKRLLLAIGLVVFFVIIVIVWYFFYAKPIIDPTSEGTNNPVPTQTTPPRFNFINKIWNTDKSTAITTTELIDPLVDPLVQIWNKPATGQTFTTKQVLMTITATSTEGTTTSLIRKTIRATSTTIIFVDKTTGYIYGYPLETGEVFQISNSVIPGIHDAYFFNNGKRVLMRYVDQEKNTLVSLLADVPTVMEKGIALPLENSEKITGGALSVSVTSSGNKIAYSTPSGNGISLYTVEGEGRPKLITTSPFKEWDLSFGGDFLYATTKPSAFVEGSTFILPQFQSEITEKTGLMTIVGDQGLMLSSMWGRQGLVTFFSYKGDTQVLPVATLAKKCSWGENTFIVCAIPRSLPKTTEGLPDDWFQGRVLFEDDLAIIDTKTGEKYSLYSFTEDDGIFDVTRIIISKKSDIFSFTNKYDETLWLLNTNLFQGE